MGTRERRERSDEADRALGASFSSLITTLHKSESSIALAAVGGYGRGELATG